MSSSDGSPGPTNAIGAVAGAAGKGAVAGPVLVIGVWTIVLMWVAAFVTHMPGISRWVPSDVTGPMMLSIMLVSIAMGTTRVPRERGVVVGLASGFLVGAVNLLILGSLLTKAEVADGRAVAAEGLAGLKPDALPIIGGFLALCVVLGLVGGLVGSRAKTGQALGEVPATTWLTRLAIAVCVAIVPLLLIGGLVTSTGSGLAVPDWPGTYEANMFLYPISLMTANGRVFLEHAHRLYGAMVGICTLLLVIYTFAASGHLRKLVLISIIPICLVLASLYPLDRIPAEWKEAAGNGQNAARAVTAICIAILAVYTVVQALKNRRISLRLSAVWLVIFVSLQGYLGGLRVTKGTAGMTEAGVSKGAQWLAVGHGMLAQVFFAMAVAFAACTVVNHLTPLGARQSRFMRRMGLAYLVAILGQLAFGAMYRHLGAKHALWTHAGFSVVVVVMGIMVAMWCYRHRDEAPLLKRLGSAVMHPIFLQFVLGWVALLAVFSETGRPAIVAASEIQAGNAVEMTGAMMWAAGIRTVHQANGAIVLAMAVLAYVWATRLTSSERA